MKKILFLVAFAFAFAFVADAQKVDTRVLLPQSSRTPTARPKLSESHLWFNTTNSDLYKYDRTTLLWSTVQTTPTYGEMSISNDTSTISFAATTPAPIEDLTIGQASGFTMVSDSVLKYNGTEAKVFRINYSACLSFAEAANIINGYIEVNGTANERTRFRQTITTLTAEREMVSGCALVSLNPGALIRFMFVPSTHTGTDVLTIYQFNLNAVQVN